MAIRHGPYGLIVFYPIKEIQVFGFWGTKKQFHISIGGSIHHSMTVDSVMSIPVREDHVASLGPPSEQDERFRNIAA